MSNSQLNLALPCYEGFFKYVIWSEPESVSKIKKKLKIKMFEENEFSFSFQSISCYGLLSTEPIINPQLTGGCMILPFFHGCRYAAIPCNRTDGVIQVDICKSRPESLVYHDHCLHLEDLKVVLSV